MVRSLLLLSIALTPCCAAPTAQRAAVPRRAEADGVEDGEAPRLTVYSGGQVRPVLEAIVPVFEKQTGAHVAYRAGSSAGMLAEAIENRDADLYIATDLRHIRTAEQKNLVMAKVPVARLRLAILVKKGNPKRLRGLEDLAREDIRVYVEDPQGCQVGTATRALLDRHRIRIARPDVALDGKPPSLRTVAPFIRADLLEAAIVWDAVAAQLADQVDVIAIPSKRNVSVNVVAVTFRFSPNPALAEEFALFLRSPPARAVWARHGFRTRLAGRGSAATSADQFRRDAERMIRVSQEILAPVYAPLAEQIVKECRLSQKTGIGIDLGSGPGTLIVELCRRTRLHWINADINPYFFSHFYRLAETHGVSHRVSAVLADAQDMPFRDDYADVVVSRGSYHLWPDRKKGFAEIYRVLKPGASAYVGRGFSRDLPVAVARDIRSRQGKRIAYDRAEEARALRKIMDGLGIRDYRVHMPRPPEGKDVHYGLWIQFRKPGTETK